MPQDPLPDLTRKEFVAMSLLVGAPKPLYGLQMVELAAGELKRGTVYVTPEQTRGEGIHHLEEGKRAAWHRATAAPVQSHRAGSEGLQGRRRGPGVAEGGPRIVSEDNVILRHTLWRLAERDGSNHR